jgi:hypothetical protein
VNHASTVSATAELPYWTSWNTGKPPALRLSTGTSSVPHRSWWVKASHTTWVPAPMTADSTNHAASRGPTGPGSRRRPRTNAYTLPCQAGGSSATSGSRSSSQHATSSAAISTSTVNTPSTEWVTSPNSMAPGIAVSA